VVLVNDKLDSEQCLTQWRWIQRGTCSGNNITAFYILGQNLGHTSRKESPAPSWSGQQHGAH